MQEREFWKFDKVTELEDEFAKEDDYVHHGEFVLVLLLRKIGEKKLISHSLV